MYSLGIRVLCTYVYCTSTVQDVSSLIECHFLILLLFHWSQGSTVGTVRNMANGYTSVPVAFPLLDTVV